MMKRRIRWLLALCLVLLTCTIAYWMLTSRLINTIDSDHSTPPTIREPDLNKPESEDEKTRRMLLGVWQDEYQGKRKMTLNADGSGTMHVELNGVNALLFASKLRFDMKWSLTGKKFTKKTISGEPADKVNLILNTMGDTADDTILELTAEQLLLLDQNGKTKYDWKRVK